MWYHGILALVALVLVSSVPGAPTYSATSRSLRAPYRVTSRSVRERMRLAAAIDPPRRPASFDSVDELNSYLQELKKYYTLLGRPRFGRSVDSQMYDGLH